LFNAYAQAINKSCNRTGGLFEEPFLRILIENDEYLKTLIVYIHRNPQNHGFVDDFKIYRHTSYQSFLSTAQTKLPREQVLNLFGGESTYEQSHKSDLDNIDWE
jgi:putative transposase